MIGIVAALGLGGYWLRRWIVPEFSGALARLADATIAVALLVVSLQILGTLSILTSAGSSSSASPSASARRGSAGRMAPRGAQEVKAPQVQTVALVIALGRRLLHGRRVDLPVPAQPRPGHVRRRHHLVPHALLGDDRPGTLDHPPSLHRSAAAGRLVLPGQHRAHQRRLDRPLQERLAGAAAEPDLAGDRAARRLVRRPPLQGRPGDAGRRRDRPRRGGDDRDPARRGPQRHHGPGLPDRLRRLPDQRPPAAGAGCRGGAGHARARRAAARQGAAGDGRDRRRAGRLGQVHVPDSRWRRSRSASSSSAAGGAAGPPPG